MHRFLLRTLQTTACGSVPVGTAGCPDSMGLHSNVALAPILAPLLIGFAVLAAFSWYLWRRFRYTNFSLAERLIISEQEVEQYRKVWYISSEEIKLGDCLGRGAVGEVYSGTWRDMTVAVKTFKGAWMNSAEMEMEMDREASVLRTIRHAHIVQFFGMGTLENGTPFIVTELMELGTLTDVLHDRNVLLNWVTKTRFAREIAQGMAFVHSMGRMHRDLKSGNILVTASSSIMHLKIGDFGTATLVTLATGGEHVIPIPAHNVSGRTTSSASSVLSTSTLSNHSRGLHSSHFSNESGASFGSANLIRRSTMDSIEMLRVRTMRTKGVGTPLWMAPEILAGERHYGPSADVYSFAIVMWEIASRKEPWEHVRSVCLGNALLELIIAEQRPTIGGEEGRKESVEGITACVHMADVN